MHACKLAEAPIWLKRSTGALPRGTRRMASEVKAGHQAWRARGILPFASMQQGHTMQTPSDYRSSHLQRGDSYDAFIAGTPFDAYMAHWESEHLRRLVGGLFPQGVGRYLDFACGTGRITAELAPLSRYTLGVDISPGMLESARKRLPETSFLACDLTQDDPDVGAFDLVTAFRFFGNAEDELREAALRAIVKRMAPGACLILNNHRNPGALYALLDRLTGGNANGMDLTLGKLRGLLRRHGLHIRKVVPIGAWMYRSRLLHGSRPDDALAKRREARFSQPALAPVAPDMIVVAQVARA